MGRYLDGLKRRGLTAREIAGGRLKVGPDDKLTPALRQQIAEVWREILAELRQPPATSPLVAAIREKREIRPSPWRDIPGKPPHDIDALRQTMIELFDHCARLDWEPWQYWEPPAPKPTQRPYCYVRADLVDSRWFYRPMIADADGTDYLWALEARDIRARKGELE